MLDFLYKSDTSKNPGYSPRAQTIRLTRGAETITARADVVGMPPGHYQKIAQVLRGKINNGGWWKDRPRPTNPPRPVRVMGPGRDMTKRWRNKVVEQILADAAINDPDDRQGWWTR